MFISSQGQVEQLLTVETRTGLGVKHGNDIAYIWTLFVNLFTIIMKETREGERLNGEQYLMSRNETEAWKPCHGSRKIQDYERKLLPWVSCYRLILETSDNHSSRHDTSMCLTACPVRASKSCVYRSII